MRTKGLIFRGTTSLHRLGALNGNIS